MPHHIMDFRRWQQQVMGIWFLKNFCHNCGTADVQKVKLFFYCAKKNMISIEPENWLNMRCTFASAAANSKSSGRRFSGIWSLKSHPSPMKKSINLCNNNYDWNHQPSLLFSSLGLDPKLLAEILGSATGRCWSVDTYNPCPGVHPNVPSSNEYKGGFGSSLMLKDLGLSQDAATRTSTSTPMGSLAMHIYRIMCHSGYENKDFSSSFEFLKKKWK